MYQVIHTSILKIYLNEFKSFKSKRSYQKLCFIEKIIFRFETYSTQMFKINTSPLIKHSSRTTKNIDDMKSSIKDFLEKLSSKTQNSNKENVLFAQILLGICKMKGLFGININEYEAMKTFDIIHNTSNSRIYRSRALFLLGVCYETGINKRKNSQKAVEYYRMAAKLGYVKALHTYGSILLYGFLKQKQDTKEAGIYLKEASKKANKTYPFPFYDLGMFYLHSSKKKEQKWAVKEFQKGVDLGCPNSTFLIAHAYETGELGLKKSKSKAIALYKKADHSVGFLKLSSYYCSSFNDIDDFLGYKYAIKAALMGNVYALETIANFYKNGVGINKSPLNALWWYQIAQSTDIQISFKAQKFIRKMVKKTLLNKKY